MHTCRAASSKKDQSLEEAKEVQLTIHARKSPEFSGIFRCVARNPNSFSGRVFSHSIQIISIGEFFFSSINASVLLLMSSIEVITTPQGVTNGEKTSKIFHNCTAVVVNLAFGIIDNRVPHIQVLKVSLP